MRVSVSGGQRIVHQSNSGWEEAVLVAGGFSLVMYTQLENNTQYFTVTTNTVFVQNVQCTVNHSKQDENRMKLKR